MAISSRTSVLSFANLCLRRTFAYRNGGHRSSGPKKLSPGYLPESPEEHDVTLQQFEDAVANEASGGKGLRGHFQEMRRQESKSAEFLKLKIIKAKYFRDDPELNILTWAAKEQMRYLHAKHPDEWTVEKLLDTFPVSRYALKRILLSQQIADSSAEIEKHDRRVRQRWQLMLTPDKCKDEKLQRTLRSLVQSGRICRIMNAGGAKDYPCPPVRTLQTRAEETPSPRGAFSLMFDRCTHPVQNSACRPPKLVEGQAGAAGKRVRDSYEKDVVSSASHAGKERTVAIAPFARAPAGGRHIAPAGMASELPSAYSQHHDDDTILSQLVNLFEPEFRRTETHATAEQLVYGQRTSSAIPEDADERPAAELYTYDPMKGYQTPFGKISSIPKTIPVPENVKILQQAGSSNLLIRRGNDFYASDGEYLYSVP